MTDKMEELKRDIAERDAKSVKAHAFSERTLTKLRTHDNTDDQAKFLANICVQLDERFGMGSSLTLEWMVDHYLAAEYFKKVAPELEALYDMLVEGKHTYVNQWEHFKGYAYYIPCEVERKEYDSKKVLVMTNENHWPENWAWLVVIDENIISENVYVRKIWKETRRNCIGTIDRPTLSFYRKRGFSFSYADDHVIYGDCRDPGHIMTYQSSKDLDHEAKTQTKVVGKCDHSISFLCDNLRWFMEVGFLHTEMTENNKA